MRWAVAVGALVAGALLLRLGGIEHGLPYVYNADENSHFVPRAIGMFGHGYNPHYFINPPGYTYLVHAAFALRWGGREAVGAAYAADPTAALTIARVLTALLGAAAVGFTAWAGRRLLGARAGLVAAALLAVAFLPVHYSHLALNDVPTLAPLCLALVGIAGVYRRNRGRDYALAGAALGVACAMKYTAAILVLCLVAAAAAGRAPAGAGPRVRGLAVAAALALAGFLIANPYALLDIHAFRGGLGQQSAAAGDGGGKLGLAQRSGVIYYLETLTWGLGWLPALAAPAGAVALAVRDRRLALVVVPAPVVFLVFMGIQDRFFARWLLPVYPLLCLLAAYGAVWALGLLAERVRAGWGASAWPAVAAAVLLCAQGVVYSVHNDVVLARTDTRGLAREWMVAHIPEGSKVVVEPIAPDMWAMDTGHPSRATGNGNRWNKWPTSRSLINNDGTVRKSGIARVVKLEDYERTTRPSLVASYARGGYCWVVTGSTQYGRAFADAREVPNAIRYYAELRRRGREVFRVRPYGAGAAAVPFSFDFSFNAYPLAYARPGPEIRIYRLCRGRRPGDLSSPAR
jgi:hypothetical protein